MDDLPDLTISDEEQQELKEIAMDIIHRQSPFLFCRKHQMHHLEDKECPRCGANKEL